MTDFDDTQSPPSGLEIETDETRAPFTVLGLRGELDLISAPQLRERALDLLREGQNRLVIDLTELLFIDSMGLSVLVLIRNRVEANHGDLTLVGDEAGSAMRVFRLSHLNRVFRIVATRDEATDRAA